MSTERDIIIERLEQKLAARDKEIAQMQESLRESIIMEVEKRFTDKIKLRDSLFEQQKPAIDAVHACENRMDRLEHRLIELNSSYDGVMKELLDQKSLIQELLAKKMVKEEPKVRQEVKPREEKSPEKPKPKGEYIIAGNYMPKERKKQAPIIEAGGKTIVSDEKEKEQFKKPSVKKRERVAEGVEIIETLKRGK
ncbi:MAG: hypothetical protein KKD69_03795 [Euryarchaeota archaeon]|nr:hypothetical protein [Euryarchaeota archaeon]MBU4491567.1 hypothetical protein [Euryarchaeota archaeon]MCG2728466.1 hypothetical protein [Candidatus Methanoperedenaceae archaeon]